MPHRLHSIQDHPKREPHPWLEEQVYARLRQRTVDLVRRSVDALSKDKERVSLSTIVAKSKELDTEGAGQGISESAILDNQEAKAYYEHHRTWQGIRKRRTKTQAVASPVKVGPVKLDRDEQRTRQRYKRMSKEALIERLIMPLTRTACPDTKKIPMGNRNRRADTSPSRKRLDAVG